MRSVYKLRSLRAWSLVMLRTSSRLRVRSLARGLMAILSISLFMMMEPAAKHYTGRFMPSLILHILLTEKLHWQRNTWKPASMPVAKFNSFENTLDLCEVLFSTNVWRWYATSAPNHSCPAKLSWRISSGNLTEKSLLARSLGIHSSMIWVIMFKTLSCGVTKDKLTSVNLFLKIDVPFNDSFLVSSSLLPKGKFNLLKTTNEEVNWKQVPHSLCSNIHPQFKIVIQVLICYYVTHSTHTREYVPLTCTKSITMTWDESHSTASVPCTIILSVRALSLQERNIKTLYQQGAVYHCLITQENTYDVPWLDTIVIRKANQTF